MRETIGTPVPLLPGGRAAEDLMITEDHLEKDIIENIEEEIGMMTGPLTEETTVKGTDKKAPDQELELMKQQS